MKVYIAGPMTGLPEFNYPAFHAAEVQLRQAGHEPVNPAIAQSAPLASEALPWDHYVRRALRLLLDSEGVALLPGWSNSRGARIEQQLATSLNMTIRPIGDWGPES